MRMKDIANRDSGRKSVGEICNHRVRQPQDERKAVQRSTFTRWMNVFLKRRDPPEEVIDLFADFQDGRILMALLEELSGCKLLYRFRSSSQRIFRLNNISKALAFLDDRHVRLPGIDATGIADGIPSAVLHLVWSMVLHFQVKKVTQGLQRHLSSSLFSLTTSIYPSSSDLLPQPNNIGSDCGNTLPSTGRKAAREPKYHGKAIKTLLQWVQRCTSRFGVEVHDFGRSWKNGLAFLALIKSINPDLVDLTESLSKQPRENIQLAFTIAHRSLDIQPLLEPEDVCGPSLDEQSIITYVSMFLGNCSATDKDDTTDIQVSEFPNCGSLQCPEADEADGRASVQGLEKSREQLLWKRWEERSPGSPVNTLITTSEATSPFDKKKSRSQSISQLPSPLDAGPVSQEIRSWMENAPSNRGDSKPGGGESHFSFSSEEGIYSLSALDSDEEEAYSYILDLPKDVFPPCNDLKRRVSSVEEETVEEMFMSRRQTKASEHLETWREASNGRRHPEDSNAHLVKHAWCERENSKLFDGDSWKIEVEKCVIKNQVVANEKEEEKMLKFNEGPERKSGKEEEGYEDEERRTEQSVGHLETLKVGVKAIGVTDKTSYGVKGAAETEEGNDGTKTGTNMEELSNEEDKEECRDGGMTVGGAAEQKDRKCETKRQELPDKAPKVADNTAPKGETRGGVTDHGVESYWTPAGTAAPPSFREERSAPQSSAALWDVTPAEQAALLLLWILLYCYFISGGTLLARYALNTLD
ncbi:uncharacterized protein clmnb isoform 2-T2 [Spinachia spinachia]